MTDKTLLEISSRIAGITVLYNPQEDVLDNIASYIDQIGLLIIVDNSDHMATGIVNRIISNEKTIYICNHGNLGIAKALNVGATTALTKGYQYLLTMDQDSKATPDMVNTLMSCFRTCDSPFQHWAGRPAPYMVT